MPGVEELGHFFKGHPLTLRLAASILSSHHYTAIEYLDKWKDHEIDENPTIISKYLFLPIEQSFRELESTDPIAAKVLTLFSYLDYKDLWYELCLIALEETYPKIISKLLSHSSGSIIH